MKIGMKTGYIKACLKKNEKFGQYAHKFTKPLYASEVTGKMGRMSL